MKVPGVIYRLGRKPDPWSVPDWASAGPDGTFGNRFDDPEGIYRVLYASSQRLGCFLETLGFLGFFLIVPILTCALFAHVLEVPLRYLFSTRAEMLTMTPVGLFFGCINDAALRAIEDACRGPVCLIEFDCLSHFSSS